MDYIKVIVVGFSLDAYIQIAAPILSPSLSVIYELPLITALEPTLKSYSSPISCRPGFEFKYSFLINPAC